MAEAVKAEARRRLEERLAAMRKNNFRASTSKGLALNNALSCFLAVTAVIAVLAALIMHFGVGAPPRGSPIDSLLQ